MRLTGSGDSGNCIFKIPVIRKIGEVERHRNCIGVQSGWIPHTAGDPSISTFFGQKCDSSVVTIRGITFKPISRKLGNRKFLVIVAGGGPTEPPATIVGAPSKSTFSTNARLAGSDVSRISFKKVQRCRKIGKVRTPRNCSRKSD